MTRFARAAGLAAIFLASGAHAQAASSSGMQEGKRIYAGIFTGAVAPDHQGLLGRNQAGVLRDIAIDYGSPAMVGVNLGVIAADGGFGRARFELELSHWQADVSALSLNDVDRVVLDGSESSVAAGFINARYDSPRIFGLMRLSLGAGFGIAGVDNEINISWPMPPQPTDRPISRYRAPR